MPSEKDKILKFNQHMKSDKMHYINYADIESLIRKIVGCANNLENSSTTKSRESIRCGYSMSTIWAFDQIEDKHTLYHGKDCMKKFCTSLWQHTKNWFWKKKNVNVNIRRIKITTRWKSMLRLRKMNLKKNVI